MLERLGVHSTLYETFINTARQRFVKIGAPRSGSSRTGPTRWSRICAVTRDRGPHAAFEGWDISADDRVLS